MFVTEDHSKFAKLGPKQGLATTKYSFNRSNMELQKMYSFVIESIKKPEECDASRSNTLEMRAGQPIVATYLYNMVGGEVNHGE